MRTVLRWGVLSLLFLLMQCTPLQREITPATLDLPLLGVPATLDPALARDDLSLLLVNLVHAGLTRYDPETASVVPDLATEWRASTNGRIYTFRLQTGLQWRDVHGNAVASFTADDVVASLRRACAPSTQAPFVDVLFVIEGCREVYESKDIVDLASVGVRALDPQTVEIDLVRPAADLPAILSLPIARPLPQDAIATGNVGWQTPERMQSIGPYAFTAWLPPDTISLIRNPMYPGERQPRTPDVVDFSLTTDALADYRAGVFDRLALPPEAVPAIQADEVLREHLSLVAQSCTVGVGFTTVKPPVDRDRVRRALAAAVDRSILVRQSSGDRVAAVTLAPPQLFGDVQPATIAYDTAQARTWLAQAGYPRGLGFPTLQLATPDIPEWVDAANAVASMWRTALDITVNVVPIPAGQYEAHLERTIPLPEIPHAWLFEWCSPVPDLHEWYNDPFHCEQSQNPWRRFCNTFDTLVEDATNEQDPTVRLDLYRQAHAAITVEEAVYVPLFHHAQALLTQPWLRGRIAPSGGWNPRTWQLDMRKKQNARER
nr:peptide ABC transporter substrate-binding protein [Ardenticatena sp.]